MVIDFAWLQQFAVSFCICLVLGFSSSNAQEYAFFESESQLASGIFGWDQFTGFYGQPHNSSIDDTSAVLTVVPGGGFVSSTMNLYAFETLPEYNFSLIALDATEEFTSIVIQFATTEVMDATRFDTAPDDFVDLGARSSLAFGEDQIDVNYYWAEWQGLDSSDSYDFFLTGMQMHVSFCAARIAYFNTSEPIDVTIKADILLGDVNCDGQINLLDVAPFVELISTNQYLDKADMNQDGNVDLLDVGGFVAVLTDA